MKELREKITDIVFMNGTEKKCDAIFCAGTTYPSIPECAARLYNDGYAPVVFVGGRYSITKGFFSGVKEKAEKYSGDYATEAEFYTDVLVRNGVPLDAILAEHMSTYTKENAVYARGIADKNGIVCRSALLVCHSFHTRRAYMYYKLQFPETEIIPIGVPFLGMTKDNWYQSEDGIERVMGEVRRIGDQFDMDELKKLLI